MFAFVGIRLTRIPLNSFISIPLLTLTFRYSSFQSQTGGFKLRFEIGNDQMSLFYICRYSSPTKCHCSTYEYVATHHQWALVVNSRSYFINGREPSQCTGSALLVSFIVLLLVFVINVSGANSKQSKHAYSVYVFVHTLHLRP